MHPPNNNFFIGERVKLLTEQITDNCYTTIPEPPLHTGTLRLAELKFPFAKCYQENHKPDKHFTEFFLMTASHGTRMFVSEVTTGEEDPLSFKHEYTFADVAPDFQIKIKLFCLKLRTSDEPFWVRNKFIIFFALYSNINNLNYRKNS